MARLASPYLIADANEAYKAYCALPLIKSGHVNKMTKRQFVKKHATEHSLRVNGDTIREAKNETNGDLLHALAELLVPLVQNLPEVKAGLLTVPVDTNARAKREADAASNGQLWRLNAEGWLSEALDASPGDYVTATAASDTLSAHLGEQ